jgi:excisionase family DNA binding protein
MEKLLLKPSEVAQVLGIGRSLIYELIARKEIPSVRLGRCIRVPAESLQRWLRDQENYQSNESKESQRQDGE